LVLTQRLYFQHSHIQLIGKGYRLKWPDFFCVEFLMQVTTIQDLHGVIILAFITTELSSLSNPTPATNEYKGGTAEKAVPFSFPRLGDEI